MDHVDEIKRRITIEDVVGSYIDLKPAGRNFKALCPFHQEKTPSFTVTPERNSFYCFGCSKGGDMFTFVEEFEGVDFRGALKILADRAGVELRAYTKEEREKQDEKEYLLTLLDQISQAYEAEFQKSKTAREYVKGRGISEKARKQFRIGFAPESWDFTQRTFPKASVTSLKKIGLIKESEKRPGSHYDRFRNRVMFPITDSSGRVIGFSGRTLSEDDKTAKYINSPETPVFKKRDALYGINKAKSAIRKRTFAILVEGQVDLVLSHDKGFPNTVAASGTALREAVERSESSAAFTLLKRLTKNLVLAFDSDKAGKDAAIKNARLALTLGMDVKVAKLPEDKDPADILSEQPEEWREIIRESADVVEFELENIMNQAKDLKAALKATEAQVFETIATVPSKAQRDFYLKSAADRVGVTKEALSADFKAFLTKKENTSHIRQKPKEDVPDATQRDRDHKNANDAVRLAGLIELVRTSKEAKSDIEKLNNKATEVLSKPPEEILEALSPPEKEGLLAHLEREFPKTEGRIHTIEETITRVTIQQLSNEARSIRQHITELERTGDHKKTKEETERYFSIQQRIDTLKNNHGQ